MRWMWLSGVLLVASACATFESGDLPLLDRWPPATASEQRSVVLEIEGLPEKFFAGWQREGVRALEQSGRFVSVATDPHQPVDRRLRLVIEQTRPPLPLTRTWMFVCAITLGVIPARAAWCFDVQAIVLDGDGTQLGVIDRSVSAASWIGWVFVFALPFAGFGLTPLVQDTMRSIILEGVEAGLL